MDINLTLLGQMITFVIFIWFTMRYVWPPLCQAMDARKKKIADGLAAAEQSRRELEMAQHNALTTIREATLKASQIVEQANQHSLHIIEEAKEAARQESARLLKHAAEEIENECQKAKRGLAAMVGTLSIDIAEKMIEKELDAKSHQHLLDKLLAEI